VRKFGGNFKSVTGRKIYVVILFYFCIISVLLFQYWEHVMNTSSFAKDFAALSLLFASGYVLTLIT